MPALLFGSISTIADTSELQRRSFNDAFAEHGLDWRWDRDDYRARLVTSGGRDRIAAYAAERGETVDADAVHATKSARFQELVGASGIAPREGVTESVVAAKAAGYRIGLVTTTSPENVAALLAAVGPTLSRADFDVVVDGSDVDAPKPDPAAYRFALEQVGQSPDEAVAVEDNPDGAASARSAGVAVVAFPNENTAGSDFGAVQAQVDALDFGALQHLVTA